MPIEIHLVDIPWYIDPFGRYKQGIPWLQTHQIWGHRNTTNFSLFSRLRLKEKVKIKVTHLSLDLDFNERNSVYVDNNNVIPQYTPSYMWNFPSYIYRYIIVYVGCKPLTNWNAHPSSLHHPRDTCVDLDFLAPSSGAEGQKTSAAAAS